MSRSSDPVLTQPQLRITLVSMNKRHIPLSLSLSLCVSVSLPLSLTVCPSAFLFFSRSSLLNKCVDLAMSLISIFHGMLSSFGEWGREGGQSYLTDCLLFDLMMFIQSSYVMHVVYLCC